MQCDAFQNPQIDVRQFVLTKIVAMCGDGAGMGTASAGMMRGRGQDFTSCGDVDGVQSCGDGVGISNLCSAGMGIDS